MVRNRKLDLMKIFQQFDTNKEGRLDISEFSQFLRQFAPGLRANELNMV
jgi:Ca2+-binding EF-hand superfamily protein